MYRPTETPSWRDVDTSMWHFWTDAPRIPRERFESQPRPPREPETENPPANRLPPKGEPPHWPAFVQRVCPPWQCPNVWSEPFDEIGSVCIPWYEVDTTVFHYKVPHTRFLIITGVSYELPQAGVADGDIFEVSLLRGTQVVARWEEYVVNNAAANPAERYLFAGHTRPYRVNVGRFDHDEDIVVRVRLRGSFPFSRTPADVANLECKILLEGYLASLRDTRDGGPKYLTNGVQEHLDPDFKHTIEDASLFYEDITHGVPE
jgi:hypothetical protein